MWKRLKMHDEEFKSSYGSYIAVLQFLFSKRADIVPDGRDDWNPILHLYSIFFYILIYAPSLF